MRAAAFSLDLSQSHSFLVRVEAFNVFNHAQFYGPQSVNGNISDACTTSECITSANEKEYAFGHVVSAAAPRLLQLAAKLVF